MPSKMATMVRRIAGWFVALVVLPLLLLVLLESGLRVAGYGYPATPFVAHRFDGTEAFVRNRYFYQMFFPWETSRSWFEDAEAVVTAEKPADAFRIFTFGGSAPEGWPGPEFSFVRFLRVMLAEQYPGVNFEVYNTARRAVSSPVMRASAEQIAVELSPDLFVVYMGNNEVQGPFGLVTENDGSMPAPMAPAQVQRRIQMAQSRLFQFVAQARLAQSRSQAEDPRSAWYWHNPIQADDPRIPAVTEAYRTNLEAIAEAALAVDAGVLLCTVPVNVRDHAPFWSERLDTLSPPDAEEWQGHCDAGAAHYDAGDFEAAIESYREAIAIASRDAELQFGIAKSLWAANQKDAARPHFDLALEYDAYNWIRAKAWINTTVRESADRLRSAGAAVALADLDATLRAASPHGSPGHELFLDGCHLSMLGSYTVAKNCLEEMHGLFPPEIQAVRRGTGVASLPECLERLGLSEYKLVEFYRDELGPDALFPRHTDEARQWMKARLATLDADAGEGLQERYREDYAAALRAGHGDEITMAHYLKRCDLSDDLARTVAQRFVADYPYGRAAVRMIAIVTARQDGVDAAAPLFERALRFYPDDPATYAVWADLLRQAGQLDAAESVVRQAQARGLEYAPISFEVILKNVENTRAQ